MMSTQTTTRPQSRVPWTSDLVVVGAATVCALVLWVTADVFGGVDLLVRSGDDVRRIGGVAVGVSAALAALVGLLVLRGLERLTRHALGVWTGLAVVVLALSVLGPLGATSTAATGTLLGLHAVVAAVVLVSAHRSRRAYGRARG